MIENQISIFELLENPKEFKIHNKVRLIELFAGVGSQAMALRDIGADFEHYRAVEFDKYAIASYNAVHGTDFPVMDVTKITGKDLGIVDCDRFTYLLTYSFPCTDLSVAGKMMGMAEGSGTRSSLLWEVRRLLDECDNLPQILVMENVPQVHSKQNMPHFQKWLDYLEGKGYVTYWQDMNAKNYGVAQSRNRTIAISILGEYTFEFPKEKQLDKTVLDYLEDEVDEKYYLKSEKAKKLIDILVEDGKIPQTNKQTNRQTCDLSVNQPNVIDVANCITARYDCGVQNIRQYNTGVLELNPMNDGTCRTIKSQYYKNSAENFSRGGDIRCDRSDKD